jgi:hypothetical protein
VPFKSKSQQRFMFAAEDRGELPKGTAERWAHHTPNIKALPEHKSKHHKDNGKHGAKHGPGCSKNKKRRKYAHTLPSILDLLYDPNIKQAATSKLGATHTIGDPYPQDWNGSIKRIQGDMNGLEAWNSLHDINSINGDQKLIPVDQAAVQAHDRKYKTAQAQVPTSRGQVPASSSCTEGAPGPLRAVYGHMKHAAQQQAPMTQAPMTHLLTPADRLLTPADRLLTPASSSCTEGAPGPLRALMDKLAEMVLETKAPHQRRPSPGGVTRPNFCKSSAFPESGEPPDLTKDLDPQFAKNPVQNAPQQQQNPANPGQMQLSDQQRKQLATLQARPGASFGARLRAQQAQQKQMQIWGDQLRLQRLRGGYDPGVQSPPSASPNSEPVSPGVNVQPDSSTYARPLAAQRFDKMIQATNKRRIDNGMPPYDQDQINQMRQDYNRVHVDAASDERGDPQGSPTPSPASGAQPQQSQAPPGAGGMGPEPGGGTARSGQTGSAPQTYAPSTGGSMSGDLPGGPVPGPGSPVNVPKPGQVPGKPTTPPPPPMKPTTPTMGDTPQPQPQLPNFPRRTPFYGMQQPAGYPTQPPPGPGRSWIYANPAPRPTFGNLPIPRGIGNYGNPQGRFGMPGLRGMPSPRPMGFRKFGSPVGPGGGGGSMAGGGAPHAVMSGTVAGGQGGGNMGSAQSQASTAAKPRGTTTGGANAQGTPAAPQTAPQGQQTAFQGQQGMYTPTGASFEHRLTPPPESKGVYIRPKTKHAAVSRRNFSPEEQQDLESGESQWLPKIFQNYSTPAHKMLASPTKQGLLWALLGGGAGALAGAGLGARSGNAGVGAAVGGAGLGALSGVVGGMSRSATNDDIKELMRRARPGATKYDLLRDNVYSADLDRQNRMNQAAMMSSAIHGLGHYKSSGHRKSAVLTPLPEMLFGGALGTGIGTYRAPKGHKTEGAARGLGIGSGTGLGAGLGSLLGLVPGIMARSPELAVAGGIGGAGLGGYGGFKATKGMLGVPSWADKDKEPEHKHKHKEEKKAAPILKGEPKLGPGARNFPPVIDKGPEVATGPAGLPDSPRAPFALPSGAHTTVPMDTLGESKGRTGLTPAEGKPFSAETTPAGPPGSMGWLEQALQYANNNKLQVGLGAAGLGLLGGGLYSMYNRNRDKDREKEGSFEKLALQDLAFGRNLF